MKITPARSKVSRKIIGNEGGMAYLARKAREKVRAAKKVATGVKREITAIPQSIKEARQGIKATSWSEIGDTVGSSSAGVADVLTFGRSKAYRMDQMDGEDYIVDKDAYATGKKAGKIAKRAMVSAAMMSGGQALGSLKYGKEAMALALTTKGGYAVGKGANKLANGEFSEGLQDVGFGTLDMYGGFKLVGAFDKTPVGRGCTKPEGCFIAGTMVLTMSGLLPIEDVQLGMRMQTVHEDRPQASSTEVDPMTWREFHLRVVSDSNAVLDVKILRPLSWLTENGAAKVGDTFAFDLPEMKMRGSARVVAIGACPEIQGGEGRVVLMTVTHLNSSILVIKLANGETIEPTVQHPFMSVTANKWVKAGDLKVGEVLRSKSGRQVIASIRKKAGTHRVYNIEVEKDHVYFVGRERVLVHNACPPRDCRASLTKSC